MTEEGLAWYATLTKPALTPPGEVFGPVWAVLYTLMAVAAVRVWVAKRTAKRSHALGMFAVQLTLNLAWSPIFFGLHRPDIAFVVIIGLWFAILFTIMAFVRVDKLAAWLLAPYFVWVSFATYLNGALYALN